MTLRILYTGNLHGDLALLPRLYTFIRSLGKVDLLLDTGNACDNSLWHCAVTGGRSTLHVLDAMGYHAANVEGYLTPEARAKLAKQALGVHLIDSGESWGQAGAYITTGPVEDDAHDLHIVLAPADSTQMQGRSLSLAALDAGQVGRVILDDLSIVEQQVLDLPPGTLPDPTIAATVEFVLDEARYTQRRHSGE